MELINELPTWAKFLVVYGPLGVGAVVMGWALWKMFGVLQAVRSAHEAEIKALNKTNSEALINQSEAHATRTDELHKEHAGKLEAQAELHHEQMTELTTRFVALNQEAFAQARSATEQATGLVDAVKRAWVRDGRETR